MQEEKEDFDQGNHKQANALADGETAAFAIKDQVIPRAAIRNRNRRDFESGSNGDHPTHSFEQRCFFSSAVRHVN